jgi:glycosyltransferase involved in cell wall biosynthesis
MRRGVLLKWQASNASGWGLLALNVFQHWACDPDIEPRIGCPIGPDALSGMDPLREMAIRPAVEASNRFAAELALGDVDLCGRRVVVLDPVGNEFLTTPPFRLGMRTIGRCVFENTQLRDAQHRLERYDSLLCASHWNADLLRANCRIPVTMIHEGIDHSQFFAGPRSGVLDLGHFYIFSGGKIEFRKGQDLVLLAFREFAAHHDDAVLVTAWHSPWPQHSAGFQGRLAHPLVQNAQGELEITRWAVENGIDPRQFIELPRTSNHMMPSILREMHCSVQVSRCEPCTNLPAKEAMACGVPVILANNTGVRDLVDAGNCVPLEYQSPVFGAAARGTEGWGESSVEEIIAALEMLYTDTRARAQIAARGAQWIVEQRRTWRDHAATLKEFLLKL